MYTSGESEVKRKDEERLVIGIIEEERGGGEVWKERV